MASQKAAAEHSDQASGDQEESHAQLSKDLAKKLSNLNTKMPTLSSVALKGDEMLVNSFLTETVCVTGDSDQVKQSQLYIASFWGFVDVVKALLDSGCNVNHQNEVSLWTPLHAAAFQEHGKLVMVLLEHKADPDIEDSLQRTPKDFASASLKIWPHFAALGYSRTPKQELIDKGIICKVDSQLQESITKDGSALSKAHVYRPAAFNRPGSSYVIQNPLLVTCDISPGAHKHGAAAGGSITRRGQLQMDSRAMAACLSGDVLAESTPNSDGSSVARKKVQLGLWRAS